MVAGGLFRNVPKHDAPYEGQPYLIDEFGGIKWIAGDAQALPDAWGYGNAPQSLDEFYTRLTDQVRAIRSHAHIAGYCYTQLTDVEQETNGIYSYDRRAKFDMAKIHAIFSG